MNHEPKSHHGHEKIIGPDDDSFNWPLVERGDDRNNPRYTHHPITHDTMHRYPDGHYYTIKQSDHDDIGSPGLRLHQESHVKDPLKYGLYRIGENGMPIRPDVSSDDFIQRSGTTSIEHESTEVLDLGAFAVNSEGDVSRTNNEKRDIDSRATPIIASYEARDRALAEGKSIEEAQRIGAEVYEVHFGMKGRLFETSFNKELPPPEPTGENFSFTNKSWQRKFGQAASDSAFRHAPEAKSNGSRDKFEEAAEFIHDMRISYPASVWLSEISPEDMQKLIDDIKVMRTKMSNDGVTDKKIQDPRIYRKFRMNLETSDEHDEKLKQAHGVLWDLMKENPKGEIPF